MKKTFLFVSLFLLSSMTIFANTNARLELSLITVGGSTQTIKVVATVINGNFEAADGTDDWSTGKITLRIKYTGANSVPIVASAPSYDPDITGETTYGYFGTGLNGFKNNFSSSIELMSYRLNSPGVGGTDDGYVYLNINDGISSPNIPLTQGTQVVLFEFQVPGSWGCNECVEFVSTDQPGIITEGTYYLNSGIGGSTNVFVIADNSTALPVELLSFGPRTKGCDLNLQWETAAEYGVENYEIEASQNGKEFRPIAHQEPHHVEGRQLYHTAIPTPYQGYFFRLKAVNQDATFTYSPVVSTEVLCGKLYAMRLFPNPNYQEHIVVEINSAGETAQLELLDAFGKLLYSQKASLEEGTNQLLIDTHYLPNGVYYIRAVGLSQLIEPLKFIRINK